MNENHKDEWENYTQEDHDDYMKALDRLGVDKTLKSLEKEREERESKELKEKYPVLLRRLDKIEEGVGFNKIGLLRETVIKKIIVRIESLEERIKILEIDNLT